MIIRQALMRQGRRLAGAYHPRGPRHYATVSIDTVERSLENSLRATLAIKTELQDTTLDIIPLLNNAEPSTMASAAPAAPPPDMISQYFDHEHQKKKIGHLGTSVSPGFLPDRLITSPPGPEDITLELLLSAQAHLGHATALWNPMNSRWIFGVREGIHIIGLEHTASHLRRACRVVEGVAERAGLILFAGTRRGQARTMVAAARRAGAYHLFDRWRAGTITNRMSLLGGFSLRAIDPLDRQVEGFSEELLEVPPLTPDLVVCMNPKENYVLLHECGLASIPTIGIVDTDADPTWLTYPIPANDDSLRCVQVVAGALSVAAQTGKQRRLEMARHGKVTYRPVNMEKLRV